MLFQRARSIFFLFALLVVDFTQSSAYKILFFPFGNKSHLIEFDGLGRVLLNRGHDVHIYLSKVDTPYSEVAKAGYKFIHPSTNESLSPVFSSEADTINRIDKSFFELYVETQKEAEEFHNKIKRYASAVLDDTQTIEAIGKEKFDFAIVDSMFFNYHMFLIPHKLGIPYGALTTVFEAINNRVPLFPSAFADAGFSTIFGVKPGLLGSSFVERLKNFAAIMFHEAYLHGWTDEFFERENVSLNTIIRNIVPHMVDQHYLLTDPLPTRPGVEMVGGLVTRPANAIDDPNILHFIQGTAQPVIVCSFGTLMNSLTPKVIQALFDAFRRVPQYRIVMKLKGANVQDKPNNVLILDWLPQNDLLAHNKTALLITHSGNNGQNEAVYHGVPMVAFYVQGDQEYNADRVARRGYGVKLNLLKFTSDALVASINEVMENDKYRNAILHAREIFRLQNAAERAADMIEHTIKFGSDHLRAEEAFDLSFFEYLMFDIVLLFFVLFTILLYFGLFVIRKILKCLAWFA